ncbi:TPA: hypothetical protein HA259_09265 [Thermoplasmata archaeon]|nr:hypothetical protein [Thermoplasmata archaeon]
MSFGPLLLPSIQRRRNEDLDRYVRHEYREEDPCWLAAENGHGPCLKLPGEEAVALDWLESKVACCPEPGRGECGTSCPFLSAISGTKRKPRGAPRGDTPGKR